MQYKWGLLPLISTFLFSGLSWAAPPATQTPYLDQLKSIMEEEGRGSQLLPDPTVTDPYIQSLKKKIPPQEDYPIRSGQSYIDRLRESDPESLEPRIQQPYTEQKKKELGPAQTGGAIQAVLDGKSELHPRVEGEIRNAFGFRFGAFLNRDFSASSQSRNFNDIYGRNFAPELSLLYEIQPFHSEWFGNVGIVGMTGIGYFHGLGQFSSAIQGPGGKTFPAESNTTFQFFTIPATLGLNYRFNLFRVIRPFIMAGPTAAAYYEKRSDGFNGNRGIATALTTQAGIAFLLDWINKSSAWDLYTAFGIKHYYLTVDYTRTIPLSGQLRYSMNGVTAGLIFEY